MSDSNKIKCPNCSHEFEITDAISRKIKAEYDIETQKLRSLLEKQNAAMADERAEYEKSKIAFEKKQKDLINQVDMQVEAEIENRERQIRQQLRDEMLKKAESKFSIEKEEYEKELAEKNKKLQEAQKTELELRKKERELELRKETLDLELERKLNEERKKIKEETLSNVSEHEKLKRVELEETNKTLREQIRELQRRSEVGSQEAQGEALEKDLLENLQAKFPLDDFVEVKKGEQGHDITQIVKNRMNNVLGKIIWEAKNTKNFNNNWIDKLKTDLQRENADYAMLVSLAMPKNVEHFDQFDEIWVTNYKSALDLCTVLRSALFRVNSVIVSEKNRDTYKDALYTYMTSDEFKRRITRIYDDFQKLRGEFEKEKRAMQHNWKRREKSMDSILTNVVSFAGDITGYLALGVEKPIIEGLALENLTNSEDTEDGLEE